MPKIVAPFSAETQMPLRKIEFALVAILITACVQSIQAQEKGAPVAPPQSVAVPDSVTEGTVTVSGHAIAYRAVAGTLVVGSSNAQDAMLGPDGKLLPGGDEKATEQATARMFYVAYFKKDAGKDRPLSFIYNGGPGGSSAPLHMGAFGPRRVVVPDARPDDGAPYKIISNNYSLLDASDLVFIDAPGTGFGELRGADKEKAFWGNDPDAHAFERFIRRFLSRFGRWNSAKYLIGESYGTTRNAQLAAALQFVNLNGIVSLSQILDFNNNADGQDFSPGIDQSSALALPTLAAVAFYHHKLPSQPPALEPFLAEVEQYALGDYMSALLQGSELPAARKQAVAERLHAYTGLPVAFLLRANLRVRGGVFTKNLLLDEGMTTGQLDARYKGPDLDPLSEAGDYDPLISAIGPAYAAAVNDYLRQQLKYGGDRPYKFLLTEAFSWDWRHAAPGGPPVGQAPGIATNVMPDLAYAMKTNPKMKILLAGGYYDIVTPFFEGIYEMHHLPIPQSLQANISYRQYAAGHMVYVDEEALRQFHEDVAKFIRETQSGK
jgi:carboxypeptidase C (cathepsin A)